MAVQKETIVAVGLSGGVDSSVAAWLLKEQGYHLIGLTMKIWDGSFELKDRGYSGCFGPGEAHDIEVAQSICRRLDIEHFTIDLCNEYKSEVLEYFRSEYLAGRTPNPCVRCNRAMKFEALLDKARSAGISFEYFATGHYVRKETDPASGICRLKKAKDQKKDQTYFLCQLKQQQLKRLIFPLGDLLKSEVRDLAVKIGWQDLAEKTESQDFIETDDYGVLFKHGELKPGAIVNFEGKTVGEHKGIAYYTIGQRRGIGSGASEPLYVTGINPQTNTVQIGRRKELLSRNLFASGVVWASGHAPDGPLRIKAKIRQPHREADALLEVADQKSGDRVKVTFDEEQNAITPGQIAAFYRDDAVIGGGIIETQDPDDS